MSERHREGLAHLLYGVQQPGGFVQLTGEIGSGKTTLCRCLIKQLPPDSDVALILNPRLTVVELLATVCDELRIPYPPHTESIKELIDALNQRLLESHAQQRRTVLIIDEAQNLHSDVLEQIRLLTNLETSQEKLLQIILIGQPELLDLLNSRALKQLSQRITARYHLAPLTRRETHAYIQHRLLVAGRRDPIFTRHAMSLIFHLSRGVPRVINIICDRALLGAYAQNKLRIGSRIVRKASRETSGYIPFYRRIPLVLITVIALLAVLAFGGAAYFNPKVRSSLGWNEGTAAPKSFATPPSERAVSAREPGITTDGSGNKNPNNAALINIISQSSPSNVSGFADLYALWGVKIPRKALSSGCKAGAAEGFECLFQTGNWPKLRRYNLPAILELLLPNGLRRQVVLCGLSKETATLIINERRYECPILEIDRLWDGSFILLWKPPFAAQKLSSGAQGEQVQWVQHALNQLDGLPSDTPVSGVYDDSVVTRVISFQRKNALIPDGRVGSETLIRLVLALKGSHVPMLSPGNQ
jgi:general secretion pathway protein A